MWITSTRSGVLRTWSSPNARERALSEAVSSSIEHPRRGLRQLLGAEVIASALVVAGAALGLFAVVVDYYRDSDNALGRTQLLLLLTGLAVMGGGIALQVRNRAHTLVEVGKFALIATQLAIVAQIIRLYQIEARIFFDVVALVILFGFVANHFVLPALRLPLFFAVGVGVILAVLAAVSPVGAAMLIGFALLLFVIADLPVRLQWRVLLILAAAAVLGALHLGWMRADWSSVAVPLVASMFMFRLVVYLYDRHNGRGPKDLWSRLSYFFLPPNPIFPFFPVVDFTTFGRSYYNADALEIYQRGVNWVLRGVIHLLLYRVVYHYFTLSPESLSSPAEFLQFIVANFALYLRISGLFHLITGLLLLFGFNLHETHSRFYFANSFIDFWRRINIYWKDFMQKIFFNPAFSRLKKLGAPHMTSVLGAMAIVFVATWALHAYQWFWMRGSFLFTWPDLLFWALLGAFLMVQTHLEENRPKRPGLSARVPLGPRAFLVLRTLCTFLTICLLWSFWTSPTIDAWLEMLGESGIIPVLASGGGVSIEAWLTSLAFGALGLFMLLVTLGVSFGLGAPSGQTKPTQRAAPAGWKKQASLLAAVSFLMLAPHVLKEVFPIRVQLFIERISGLGLNARDEATLTRGYYEDLTNTNRFNSPLWEAMMFKPDRALVSTDQPGFRWREDYLRFDFRPLHTVVGLGGTAQINRWGMRDRDYSLEKPSGVVRIAVIEASRAAGLGVRDEDVFEARLEQRLNAELAGGDHRFEVLNFSVHGHIPIQRLYLLEQRALRFAPDVVLYIGGPREDSSAHIAHMYREGAPSPYPFIESLITRLQLRREMSRRRITALLAQHHVETLDFIYSRFASAARAHGATPIYVYLPALDGTTPDIAEQRLLADEAGFVILNLDEVYSGRRQEELQLTPSDYLHPSAVGHGMIADALFAELVSGHDRVDLTPDRPGAMP
jgi:D-alanyl-lipoteichoic acid acyltransferase DltB (MBOAT superfamily)